MEQRQYIYSPSEGSNDKNDSSNQAVMQRRRAIQLFLSNPEAAIELYPQLEQELITFFSQSSNPHMDDMTGQPLSGREEEYRMWEEVQRWARTH